MDEPVNDGDEVAQGRLTLSQPTEKPLSKSHAEQRPIWYFFSTQATMTAASVCLYAIFHAGAYVAEWLGGPMPLSDERPATAVSLVLNWGGGLGLCVSFSVVTVYQIITLNNSLRRQMLDQKNQQSEVQS